MSSSNHEPPSRLDELPTEAWNADGADLDLRSTLELVMLMNEEDAGVPPAVARAAEAVAGAVDAIAARLHAGGRLVYVGAGTSGRLAALDAAECESTFSTRPGQVVALIAGGTASAPVAQEAAEDDAEAGERELGALGVTAADAVVGVSASGRTPYVLGAMRRAARAGALTVAIVSVPDSELALQVEHEVVVVVGPEIIAGSTRLKAGTAQKLVLNMLSTLSMVRIGKTFGNLMVDVYATNEKLHARVRRVVRHATGATPEAVEQALADSGGDAKVAIVSLLSETDAATARERLDAADGLIRRAVEPR
jgi:N-acetylmuramic acid 6-phosphate etherase